MEVCIQLRTGSQKGGVLGRRGLGDPEDMGQEKMTDDGIPSSVSSWGALWKTWIFQGAPGLCVCVGGVTAPSGCPWKGAKVGTENQGSLPVPPTCSPVPAKAKTRYRGSNYMVAADPLSGGRLAAELRSLPEPLISPLSLMCTPCLMAPKNHLGHASEQTLSPKFWEEGAGPDCGLTGLRWLPLTVGYFPGLQIKWTEP